MAAALIAVLGPTLGCGGNPPTGPSAPPVSGLFVSAISPNTGGLGATDVTIQGRGFEIGAIVTFDGLVANATVTSSTVILARTPGHTAGRVDVVVINPGGQSSRLTEAFTYAPEPSGAFSIKAMTPLPGSTAGGTSVTISGSGIQPGATVLVDGALTDATVFAGLIYLVTPPHTAGLVDVVVANPGGQSASLAGSR